MLACCRSVRYPPSLGFRNWSLSPHMPLTGKNTFDVKTIVFPILNLGFLLLGKSKGGLTNGGLSPKFSEKIGGKSFLENRTFSGQIGAISGLVGAFSGPIGTNSSAPHSHGGRAKIAPKGPFLARLAPFGLSPPLLSPVWISQILRSPYTCNSRTSSGSSRKMFWGE